MLTDFVYGIQDGAKATHTHTPTDDNFEMDSHRGTVGLEYLDGGGDMVTVKDCDVAPEICSNITSS